MSQHGSHEDPDTRFFVEEEPDTEGHVMTTDADDAADDDDVTAHILLQVEPPRDEGGTGFGAR